MPTRNPWKRLSSREVYRNPWLTLREDQVIRPDGNEGIYSVIETRVATAACALTPERELFLVGQYRYPLDVYSWEIVEGGTDGGETPLEAIQRELREEAGLVARQWTPLGGEIHMSNCISSEKGFVFVAEDLEEVGAAPDVTEVLQVKRVPFDDALAMVDSGEIVDAFSILGILRLERFLAKRDAS